MFVHQRSCHAGMGLTNNTITPAPAQGDASQITERRGPWGVVTRTRAFDNPWIGIDDHEVVTPSGGPGRYGVVSFKNRAIAILPVFANGDVMLVGQHRFPTDHYSWELPEGGGPLDEAPLLAAQRELKEETGLIAQSWSEIGRLHLSNSVTNETGVCFLATGLTQQDAEPEPDEILATRRVPFMRMLDEVMAGEILDALTIVVAFRAYYMARENLFDPALANALLSKEATNG